MIILECAVFLNVLFFVPLVYILEAPGFWGLIRVVFRRD